MRDSVEEFIEGAKCSFCGGPIRRCTWMAPDVEYNPETTMIDKVSDKKIPTDYGSCHHCGFRYTIKEAEELARRRDG